MDKFTLESLKHGVIFEWLTTFKGTMDSMEGADFWRFRGFLDDYIYDHFQFEESKWFNMIRQKGDSEEIAFARKLELQHEQILDLISSYKESLPENAGECDLSQQEKLLNLKNKIVHELLEHAQNEDLELFPILKKYHLNASQA